MKNNVPRLAQRKAPHEIAEKFKAEMRPTLISYEEEFLAYESDGAYRLIKNKTMMAEAQSYLEGAQEMRPLDTRKPPTMGAFPFNPKNSDVEQLFGQLERKNHIAPGTIAPPFFLPGEMDWSFLDPRDVIACRNGLLQISTRRLYNSSSQYFTRTALPIDYDSAARPERWLTFLDEVLDGDADLILLVQQMFGYFVTTDTTRQAIFYFRGVTGSGKSTIMRVLDALIGERNICNVSIKDLAERSTLNDMTGKTLAKITDMNTSNPRDLSEAASNLNRISGDDPVHVFRKFLSGINVKLGVRFLMAGNQFPNFGEHATALARRLKVIPFNRSFEDVADPDLSRKLIDNELPAILNWALDGLDDLQLMGEFVVPAASLAARKIILNSGDPIRSFAAEDCELDPALEVNKDELFRRYQLHCQKIGAKMPLTKPKFISALMTAFNGVRAARPRTDDGGREHVMVGIGLKDCDEVGERVPTITFKLDSDALALGFERWEPEAILRDANGKPIEYVSADFDE
jgi:putative DNA primase/helicase